MKCSPLDHWIWHKHQIEDQTKRRERDGLEAYQLERFRRLLTFARDHSPYYKAQLGRGYPLKTMADISQLPFSNETILRNHGHRMLCVSQSEIAHIVTLSTSGTTGQAKRVFFTDEDLELTIDFFCHGMATLAHPGQKVMVAMPAAGDNSVGSLLSRGLTRLGAIPVGYGIIENLRDAAEFLAAEQPEVCVGIPVQMLALARYCTVMNVSTQIKTVLLSADYAPAGLIRQLEQMWGCEVYNHYGMTEMGLGGAIDCDAHAGMHIRENDLYVEVVDPATGVALPDDTPGELVFTTLTRTGMPLIRYRTGDQGMVTSQRCRCGSILKRVRYIGERVTAEFFCGGGIQELDERLFGIPGIIDYRISRSREDGRVCTIYRIGGNADEILKQCRAAGLAADFGISRIELQQSADQLIPFQGKRRLS